MTDKELRKLRRSELLEMLLEQKKTVNAAERKIDLERTRREETENQLKESNANNQWLRSKLDEKEQEIHELRAALEAQNSQPISDDSIRKVTARMNTAVEAFEKAVEKLLKK